jgi:hypothetical protein
MYNTSMLSKHSLCCFVLLTILLDFLSNQIGHIQSCGYACLTVSEDKQRMSICMSSSSGERK